MSDKYGKVYIVSTPIGNLQDITFRAIDTLKEVDLIAAEDTRRTQQLLNHFDINTKITSYHEHNKFDKAIDIVEKIKQGLDVAIVTDAGTPIISDPGNELIKMALKEEIEVTAIPGCCAAINALVLSGLDAKSFVFIGFLPDDGKKRKELIEELSEETRTMIFYIAPHDILKSLKSLIEVFGTNRLAALSREMTKIHEECKRGTLEEIYDEFNKRDIKGEFVLVVDGIDRNVIKEKETDKWSKLSISEHYNLCIKDGLSDKDAIKRVARERDMDKRDVYRELKVK